MITVEITYTNKKVIKQFKNWEEACFYCHSDGDHCLDWKLVKETNGTIHNEQ